MKNSLISGDSLILLSDGNCRSVLELSKYNDSVETYSMNERNNLIVAECVSIIKTQVNELMKITFNNSFSIKCGIETSLMSTMGFPLNAQELKEGDSVLVFGKTRTLITNIEKIKYNADLFKLTINPYSNFIVVNPKSLNSENKNNIEGIVVGEF